MVSLTQQIEPPVVRSAAPSRLKIRPFSAFRIVEKIRSKIQGLFRSSLMASVLDTTSFPANYRLERWIAFLLGLLFFLAFIARG